MHNARVLSVALVAFLTAPAIAAEPVSPPIPADEVTVTTPGGLISANVPGYTLRFTRDGDAIYDGRLNGYDGHYVAKADFVPVEAAIEHERLCEGNGIPFIVPPRQGYARTKVVIHVRCGGSLKTYNDSVDVQLPELAKQLLMMGKDLSWQRTGPAQRQTLVRFAH